MVRVFASLGMLTVAACCPRLAPARRIEPRYNEGVAQVGAAVFQPSEALAMLRSERLAARGHRDAPATATSAVRVPASSTPSAADPSAGVDASAPAAPASADTHKDPEAAEDPVWAEGETRTVRVRTSRFATAESLMRSWIRSAEPRRPRLLHPPRMLFRAEGPIRVCDGPCREHAGLRHNVRRWLVAARRAVKACILRDFADDPRILLHEPSTLAIDQLRQRGIDPVLRFRITGRVRSRRVIVQRFETTGPSVSPAAEACITDALAAHAIAVDSDHHVFQVPVVAFSQGSSGVNWGSWHHRLAMEAAIMGSLLLQRGDAREALEYFRDAHWAFHLPEFEYLIGRALMELGDNGAAATALRRFLEARPWAPERDELVALLAALER